jgi:2-hydroxychromene-2-carboxylate isomerase
VLHVRSWPLERVNGEPLTADFVAEEVAAVRASVAPDLFAGFDPAAFPATTIPALTLAASAYRRALRAGERVSLALRRALFEEGRDVADPAELAAVAAACDVPPPPAETLVAVDEDWHEGERRGVLGSPHFFIDGQGFFCPTLNIERVDDHLRVTLNEPGADEFLERCLGAGAEPHDA